MIHPSASIDRGAELAEGVCVGPFAVIESGVRIGQNATIGAHAVMHTGTIVEENVSIGPHSVIGGLPQDLRFESHKPSGVLIRRGACIREFVSINRSHEENGQTYVGCEAFLMTGAHMGHGSSVGDSTILANAVMLAGHVQVGAHAFVGGGAGIHQFVRVGESAMVGGLARISRDVPPYLMVAERDEVSGLNFVGLRRRGFSVAVVRELKHLYHTVYARVGGQRERAQTCLSEEANHLSAQGRLFLEFFSRGRRGFVQPLGTHAPKGRFVAEQSIENKALDLDAID